jgi:SAM-dependent methyltransferase
MSQLVDYYQDRYWNELPAVLSYLSRLSTGDPCVWWMDYIKAKYAAQPRNHGLVIGCGNGWVERDLFDRGIALHFDAFDISDHYLREAEAKRGNRSITYFRSSFDSFTPNKTYDLIVNVAALHHARTLYGFLLRLAPALESDGIFVNWDYTGPSRNQYPLRQVGLMLKVNALLPTRFRTNHPIRPSLRTLLTFDQTEAVHSSEIRRAVNSSFDVIESAELGGGIAYQLLWNNLDEFEKDDATARSALQYILAADEAHTREGNVPSLFSFFICRRRRTPRARALLDAFIREPIRERVADCFGGLYLSELPSYLAQEIISNMGLAYSKLDRIIFGKGSA